MMEMSGRPIDPEAPDGETRESGETKAMKRLIAMFCLAAFTLATTYAAPADGKDKTKATKTKAPKPTKTKTKK
jgi:hypothetical protein